MIYYVVFPILFIWMNLYYLSNLTKLEVKFYQLEKSSISLTQYLYYITKIIYWVWLFFGFFSPIKTIITVILSFYLLKFIVYFVNRRFYKFINVFFPFLTIIALFIVMFFKH